MPEGLRALPADGAALLVESRAATAAALAVKVDAIVSELGSFALAAPLRFTTDPAETAALWNVRKGMFPAVGAVRPTGHHGDHRRRHLPDRAAWPKPRSTCSELFEQARLRRGDPLRPRAGRQPALRLHPGLQQRRQKSRATAVHGRLCAMVVGKYDGSLKAEHGTGRNMAPFVELEWGGAGVRDRCVASSAARPERPPQPGRDPQRRPAVHLKDLKPLPAADRIVDKCIECGFCEPMCPSRGLTLSPRQRIVVWREIAGWKPTDAIPSARRRRRRSTTTTASTPAPPPDLRDGLPGRHRDRPAHQGIARASREPAREARRRDGGNAVRGRHHRRPSRPRRRRPAARHRRHVDDEGRSRWPAQGFWRTIAQMVARARAPGALRTVAPPPSGAERLVYFPSCAARNMGPQRGHDGEMLPTRGRAPVPARRLRRRLSAALDGLCCGQPFESKGLRRGRRPEVVGACSRLREASENGRWPIVFDTSPCAYRMKKVLAGSLAIQTASTSSTTRCWRA